MCDAMSSKGFLDAIIGAEGGGSMKTSSTPMYDLVLCFFTFVRFFGSFFYCLTKFIWIRFALFSGILSHMLHIMLLLDRLTSYSLCFVASFFCMCVLVTVHLDGCLKYGMHCTGIWRNHIQSTLLIRWRPKGQPGGIWGSHGGGEDCLFVLYLFFC